MLLAGVPIVVVTAVASAVATLVARARRDEAVVATVRAQLREVGEVRRAVHEVRSAHRFPDRHTGSR